eukprot:319391-Chlamydomonas_euryale.AAC.2
MMPSSSARSTPLPTPNANIDVPGCSSASRAATARASRAWYPSTRPSVMSTTTCLCGGGANRQGKR